MKTKKEMIEDAKNNRGEEFTMADWRSMYNAPITGSVKEFEELLKDGIYEVSGLTKNKKLKLYKVA